jgi:hypothetical protein
LFIDRLLVLYPRGFISHVNKIISFYFANPVLVS